MQANIVKFISGGTVAIPLTSEAMLYRFVRTIRQKPPSKLRRPLVRSSGKGQPQTFSTKYSWSTLQISI